MDLRKKIERGDITRIVGLSGWSWTYVTECLSNPDKFKGSSTAKLDILAAFEKVYKENQKATEKGMNRLAKLLNKSDE